MSTITECLTQMQKLTQTNLDILSALNGALRGDSTSTKVEINGKTYDIPSFISLENKINALQENLNNIVNAPATGEAFINFNGNSRVIEMRGYTSTPNSLTLNTASEFGVEPNNIFKDFLTPIPYISFELSEMPNDITSVNIKKIIPRTEKMVEFFQTQVGATASTSVSYSSLIQYFKKYGLVKGQDYTEYDTVKKLPVRKSLGQGEYLIQEVLEDTIDENLDNYITVQLASGIGVPTGQQNVMTFVRFDGTIETYLAPGDKLVTYDDGAKLEVIEVDYNNLKMKLKVLNGEYLNLLGISSYIDDGDSDVFYENVSNVSKLKFFSPVDLSVDKTVNVPLEEDTYVFIAIAPLNDRLNIQSSWGYGVAVNTNYLYRTLSDNSRQSFKNYYAESVRNIGDCLNELTSMMPGELTKFVPTELVRLVNVKPDTEQIIVTPVQINKHLNSSPVVENIKKLYSQKTKYQQELDDVQLKIDECNQQLASISITDTTGIRSVYKAQLKDYNNKRNEISTSITNIIDQLSLMANDSTLPIDGAKFHIRGYFDIEQFNKSLVNSGFGQVAGKIRGIEVQYRYINENAEQSFNPNTNVASIDSKFIYSEWNIMPTFHNPKVVSYNYGYKFKFADYNNTANEPSFNQIDIPITQGEKVELRLRVLYDYGYPYVKITSVWSDIVTATYPIPAKTDIQVKTIISENNNDIETNRFKNLLDNNGVMNHVGDEMKDQDLVYYHKSDNIASGFYTTERRVIPLKDKLQEMNNAIAQLNDEINDANNTNLKVTVNIGSTENIILPNSKNNIYVDAYSDFIAEDYINTSNGAYDVKEYATRDENGNATNNKFTMVTALLNLTITNDSSHSAKLYPLFPGDKEIALKDLQHYKYTKGDYVEDSGGVYLTYNNDSGSIQLGDQLCNQFITFRIKNLWDGEYYYNDTDYATDPKLFMSEQMPLSKKYYANSPTFYDYFKSEDNDYDKQIFKGSIIYPFLPDKDFLLTSHTGDYSYKLLGPNESITIPIIFEYNVEEVNNSTSKKISFDLRTSLYKDPIPYTIHINAKYINKAQDNLLISNKKNSLKYKTLTV